MVAKPNKVLTEFLGDMDQNRKRLATTAIFYNDGLPTKHLKINEVYSGKRILDELVWLGGARTYMHLSIKKHEKIRYDNIIKRECIGTTRVEVLFTNKTIAIYDEKGKSTDSSGRGK